MWLLAGASAGLGLLALLGVLRFPPWEGKYGCTAVSRKLRHEIEINTEVRTKVGKQLENSVEKDGKKTTTKLSPGFSILFFHDTITASEIRAIDCVPQRASPRLERMSISVFCYFGPRAILPIVGLGSDRMWLFPYRMYEGGPLVDFRVTPFFDVEQA